MTEDLEVERGKSAVVLIGGFPNPRDTDLPLRQLQPIAFDAIRGEDARRELGSKFRVERARLAEAERRSQNGIREARMLREIQEPRKVDLRLMRRAVEAEQSTAG